MSLHSIKIIIARTHSQTIARAARALARRASNSKHKECVCARAAALGAWRKHPAPWNPSEAFHLERRQARLFLIA